MAPYADLADAGSFPSWSDLPSSNDKHVCFLVEIQQCDGFLLYRTIVKDRKGEEIVVAFYPDNYNEGFDFKQLKKGHTLAIMNALQHGFLDGTHGVRVDSMDDVCVFPIGLQAARELGTEVAKFAVDKDSEQWKCHGCGVNKPVDQMSRCGQCKTYSYCSKECQVKGWSEKRHQSTCKVLSGPNLLSLLKLDFAAGPRSNSFVFQRR